MIAFTILGLILFWWICFELGYFLAWAAAADGILMALARVLVGTEELEKSMRAFIVGLNWKEVTR